MTYHLPEALIDDAFIEVLRRSDRLTREILVFNEKEIRNNIIEYYSDMNSFTFKWILQVIRQTMQSNNFDFTVPKILELKKAAIQEFLEYRGINYLPLPSEAQLNSQAQYLSSWLENNWQWHWKPNNEKTV